MGSPQPTPQPPAEATLIRLAREASGLTSDEAAARAPIRLGGARWRQLERGYERPGQFVVPNKKTLAHMAAVVGVEPERLEEVGRSDAAVILREILRQKAQERTERSETYADLSDEHEALIWGMSLPEEKRRHLIDALRAGKCAEGGSDDRRAV